MQQKQLTLQKHNLDLVERLKTTMKEKEEAEICFQEASALNKEQLEQSTTSYNKLCEATNVADEALMENQTLRREKHQIEEELNNLAKTIGNVIDVASSKVERDVEELKGKHKKEKEDLNKEIERLNLIIKEQSMLDSNRESEFHQKISSMEQINSALTDNLQSALNTVVRTFLAFFSNSLNF